MVPGEMDRTVTTVAVQAIDSPAAVASDVGKGIATGETSIVLPRAARLASWAVTDPNQLRPAFFSFKDISCVIKSEGVPKVLLDMISGYCRVGWMRARWVRQRVPDLTQSLLARLAGRNFGHFRTIRSRKVDFTRHPRISQDHGQVDH